MRLPTISRYMESVEDPHGLFRTLGPFEAERDMYGEIRLRVGNNAVVFTLGAEGGRLLLKCFTRFAPWRRELYEYVEALDSPLLSPVRLLREEMYVYDHDSSGRYYDVLVGRWTEGSTLEQEIRRAVAREDVGCLGALSSAFESMALELLAQPWAHGDLKPENIVVTREGAMVLIDYDAMYAPGLSHGGETGTEVYQHPGRGASMYDGHVDDYSIALIASGLKLLAMDPSLYGRFNGADNMIFDPAAVLAGTSEVYRVAVDMAARAGDVTLYRLLLCLACESPYIPELASLLRGGAVWCDGELSAFCEKGRWGYLDGSGRQVVPAFMDSAASFKEALAAVVIGGYNHYLDRSGRVAVNCSRMEEAGSFNEGLAAVCIDGRWGFMDTSGEVVIEPRFEMAGSMREGMAVVRLGGLYGFIDRRGRMAIEPEYDFATGFDNGTASVEKNKKIFRISKTGAKVFVSD